MPLPFVPGAAGAGIVERVGDAVVGVAPGDAVIVNFAACGLCEACAVGDPRRCIGFAALNLGGRRLDGSAPFSAASEPVNGFFFGQSSFSTHLICAATSATTLPAGAALEVLAGLPGEMLVGAGAVDGVLGLRRGDTLVITGADAAGLAATMMAKARGAGMIIVADPRERRRDFATALGATVAVHTDDDLAAVVRSLTGDGVRFALETIGHAAARQACLDSLAPGGTLAIVDPLAGETLADEILAGDTRVVAAHGHADPRGLLAELATLHAAGDLPLDTLVDFFPFEHANDALDALRAERVVKPVIRFPVGSFGDLDRALSEGAAQDVPETTESTSDDRVPAEAPAQDDGDGERQPAVPA
jgi:aryl-alcohol dehydrogenase